MPPNWHCPKNTSNYVSVVACLTSSCNSHHLEPSWTLSSHNFSHNKQTWLLSFFVNIWQTLCPPRPPWESGLLVLCALPVLSGEVGLFSDVGPLLTGCWFIMINSQHKHLLSQTHIDKCPQHTYFPAFLLSCEDCSSMLVLSYKQKLWHVPLESASSLLLPLPSVSMDDLAFILSPHHLKQPPDL